MKKRPIYQELIQRLNEPRKFIQVLLGPRQVGKTTLAVQVAEEIQKPVHYISADIATLEDLSWIRAQWELARLKVDTIHGALFIIDEVQKIPKWSEVIKSLWDEDSRMQLNLTVMILGSSPWLIQKGLSESLAGRFEILPITHWSFTEMEETFRWTCDEYIYFGGYPGAATLANSKDPSRWMNYINDSLIEMTISRDILLMTQVNKPALLRRLFQFGCLYSGQLLSYSKMMGQLEDAGNTTTLAHYLDLLSGAWLLCGLQKFANQPVRQKNSSPKFVVYNTALMSAQKGLSFEEAKKDRSYWGRLIESAIGAHLLNSARMMNMELFYWREGDKEVDFVLRFRNRLIAIEVKSSSSGKLSGMDAFIKDFQPSKVLLVGDGGIPVEEFLSKPLTNFI